MQTVSVWCLAVFKKDLQNNFWIYLLCKVRDVDLDDICEKKNSNLARIFIWVEGE